MSFTPIEHFLNLAFAIVNPLHTSPQACIRHALHTGAGNPPVLIRAASYGAGLVVFGSAYEREISILNSPLSCLINTVSLVRHKDTENRFLFRLGTVSALHIEDFPLEYWFTPTIINSIVPFACPIQIDPICLTGVDYSVVLVSVKSAPSPTCPTLFPSMASPASGPLHPFSSCTTMSFRRTPPSRASTPTTTTTAVEMGGTPTSPAGWTPTSPLRRLLQRTRSTTTGVVQLRAA